MTRLAAAQKPGRAVPAYTRYVNRWLGRRLAAAAYLARLTPNQVTWASLAASAAGIALLVTGGPSWATGLGVAALLCLGYALDSADGQLARLLGTGGPAGEWFDHVADAGRMPAIHLAVLVHLAQLTGSLDSAPATGTLGTTPALGTGTLPGWAPVVAMVFLVATTARFMGQILAEQLRRDRAAGLGELSGTDAQAARRAVLQLPSDTGILCLGFILVGAPFVFFIWYAVLAAANVLLAVASFRRRHRELITLAAS